jgi:hypothetical protein
MTAPVSPPKQPLADGEDVQPDGEGSPAAGRLPLQVPAS